MEESMECPECGKKVRRGSTFCMGCGSRLATGHESPATPVETVTRPNAEVQDDSSILLTESELEDIPEPGVPADAEATLPETELPELAEPEVAEVPAASEVAAPEPPEGDLSWEVDESLVKPVENEDSSLVATDEAAIMEVPDSGIPPDAVVLEDRTEGLDWDEMGVGEEPEIKVGMPFKEIEPPSVVSDEIDFATDVVIDHLFPEGRDDETREAVSHLFPEGRGVTSKDFIDVVVGTPTKVSVATPMVELDAPSCPSCGVSISGDEFEYPDYVYDSMGRARLEDGDAKLKEKEYELAIEAFEKAKTLYERAGNQKMVDECTKKTDLGYDAMANNHFEQGENHQKANEYEWAIVQYRKARELYMFSTDSKKRARCAAKVRECYVEWGKSLETEGDALAKSGNTREALANYQEAAEKYRQADEKKRLKVLDKKIRKA
ncbi:MAG: zinc-ribbon domain-containing protein [Candidatus Thorarchaeota archaeon]